MWRDYYIKADYNNLWNIMGFKRGNRNTQTLYTQVWDEWGRKQFLRSDTHERKSNAWFRWFQTVSNPKKQKEKHSVVYKKDPFQFNETKRNGTKREENVVKTKHNHSK